MRRIGFWLVFFLLPLFTFAQEVSVAAGAGGKKDEISYWIKKRELGAFVKLIEVEPNNETKTFSVKIRAQLASQYRETSLQILGLSEKPDPMIDQRITCTIRLYGRMFGVESLIRCEPPNGGIFVGREFQGIDDPEKFSSQVSILVEDLYHKALKIHQ